MKNITKEQNLAFRKANKARKRVMIAKDVIRQLDANKIITADAGYFAIDNRVSIPKDGHIDLQAMLKKSETECRVCAMGAVFCSLVLYRNKFKSKPNFGYIEEDRAAISDYMADVFDKDQLSLLECLFEGYSSYGSNGLEFGSHYLTHKYHLHERNDRLRWLMKNIIKNKGELIVEGING